MRPLDSRSFVIEVCSPNRLSLPFIQYQADDVSDHVVLLLVGGEVSGEPLDRVTAHVLPDAKSNCKSAPTYPLAISGAVGVLMSKEITVCGGLIKMDDPNKKGEVVSKTTAGERPLRL